MKSSIIILLGLLSILYNCTPIKKHAKSIEESLTYKQLVSSRVILPNGWSLTPVGKSIELDDLPLNLVVSNSKKMLAVTNNGQSTQSIMLIDASTNSVLDKVEVKKAWVGLAFTHDDQYLIASGGNDNLVLVYKITEGKLLLTAEIRLGQPYPKEVISPAGLCVDFQATRIYVVAKDSKSLFVCDLKQMNVLKTIGLESEPYSCALSPKTGELFISLWGGSKVVVYNPKTDKIEHEIKTNSHPNDLLFTSNGKYLFVPNGNDNTISLIDADGYKVIEHINASLYPNAPIGSTPNGVALSEDEKTLYVANADNNCLAV